MFNNKKLQKSNHKRMLFGVCGGFSDYFNIDPTVVRVIFVILGLIKGVGIILYIVCSLIMPSDPSEISVSEDDDNIDNLKSANISDEKVPHTDEEFNSYFSKK